MVSTFERHAIVTVPFPYADQLAEKRRPALVISSQDFHSRTGLAWVVMITSAKNPAWTDDITIRDHAACGLPAPSVIRPAKIATIDLNRVVATLGIIASAEADRVREFYSTAFG
jgi:mRNA interferase MazF